MIQAGSKVEIKHPETGQTVEATINKVTDSSTYTVVFDDGDENTLRRTQLCLKGEKHFVKSEVSYVVGYRTFSNLKIRGLYIDIT